MGGAILTRLAVFCVGAAGCLACSQQLDVAALGEGCPADFKDCGGECLPLSDPACPPCPVATKPCGGQCVGLSDPALGCAAAACDPCVVPHGTPTCDEEGACVPLRCDSGHKVCASECVSTDRPDYGCGRVSCAPCFFPDAVAECRENKCEVAGCIGPKIGNCNRSSEDGCEANLNDSPEHCGKCKRPCEPLDHAESRCTGGRCVIRRCMDGYADLDGKPGNGCEVEVPTR